MKIFRKIRLQEEVIQLFKEIHRRTKNKFNLVKLKFLANFMGSNDEEVVNETVRAIRP